MSAPVRVDNITLSDATDFDGFVLEVLRGRGGVGSLRSDNAPVDWIFRAYDQLKGTPYADRLSRGVAAALTVADPSVQSQALVFFASQPKAAGAERLVDLVAGNRAGFAGVSDPMHPSVDLEWQLLAAFARQVDSGDVRSVGLAKAEAVLPGKAQPFIGALFSADADWVISHVEQIVRGTPAAGITILLKLQSQKRDLVQIGRRIAPLCHGDARFEDYVTRFIDDPAARQVLLEAFRGTGN